MTKIEEKYSRKRYRNAYGTSVVSISLVLFMLGLLALMILHTSKLSEYVRESIGVSVMLKDAVSEREALDFQSGLDSLYYVKSTELITRDEAAQKLKDELGEDFIDFLGYNPLPSTIVIYLHSQYTFEDSIHAIREKILSEDYVKDVDFQQSLVELVNRNVTKVGMVLAGFSGILLIISVLLIFNTIRLAVFARRFLIKSMLLVGATPAFIRRPFIINGVLQGLAGGAVSVVLLAALLYLAQNKIPEITVLQDVRLIVLIFVGVVVFGVLITWLSNFFAVKKYLKTNSDALY
jgi:cell division transport system permease protein